MLSQWIIYIMIEPIDIVIKMNLMDRIINIFFFIQCFPAQHENGFVPKTARRTQQGIEHLNVNKA